MSDTDDQAIATVLDYRAALVAMLGRSLVGPGPDNEPWLSPRTPTSFHAAPSEGSGERPIGPFVDATGQEVLPVSPRSLYVAGVLWGSHADDSGPDESDAEDGVDEPAGGNGRKGRRGKAAVAAPPKRRDDEARGAALDDLDDEQLADDVDSFGKRRSLAVSFRVPSDVRAATAHLSYGTYEATKHQVGSREETVWTRSPHQRTCTIDLAASGEVDAGDLPWRIRIGTTVRDAGDGSRLVTVWVRNDTGTTDVQHHVSGAMFQTSLVIDVDELLPYAPTRVLRDSLDLLYRDVVDLAVGHGTDVDVSSVDDGRRQVRTVAMPVVEVPAMTPDVRDADGQPYRVGMRDLGEGRAESVEAVERLIDGYAAWIRTQEAEATRLPDEARGLAADHLARCAEFLGQVREGWALATSDSEVGECLRDASRAMDSQRRSMGTAKRSVESTDNGLRVEGQHPHRGSVAEQGYWRPFQIAFILASLPRIVDPSHPTRSTVDVIWMPTGGGKTEAYLGLAAFTILWERSLVVRGGKSTQVPSTRVLMRYTLRLLTVQQFLRSAALVCALEVIRRSRPERYGSGEVRIGTWVGSSTTDNTRAGAVKKLNAAAAGGEPHGFLLTQCPWCAASMGETLDRQVVGYRKVEVPTTREKRVLASCPDPACEFHYRTERVKDRTLDRGLPIMTVDEDVYDFAPDFVIGTVDKVAMMWNQTDAQRLFGLRDGTRRTAPPTLFIQDELHLINGPLGSLDGAFEVMLETLCTADGGTAPVFVASTATTRNFTEQIGALYDRAAALVPPPGLTVSDSFFSTLDPAAPGRLYVGVCSSGGVANADTQNRVLATLAHFGASLEDLADGSVDPDAYWTNVCFFSSRAALGTLTSTVETGMRSALDTLRRVSGASSGPFADDGSRRPRRLMGSPREITATASENVTEVLDDLGLRRESSDAIDLCFATSMIEVGLDVPRLGLMTVIGQPKGSSQYIQVTGRVGRSAAAPALVVDVLGTRTPRDRSHYEHFIAWHRRLYASVEGASVTPFTERALDRTLSSVAAVLCRVLGGSGSVTEQVERAWPTVTSALRTRAARFGPRAVAVTDEGLDRLWQRAHFDGVSRMSWTSRDQPNSKFLFAFGEDIPPGRPPTYWQVLTSMRSVDPDAPARAHNPGIAPIDPRPGGATGGDDDDEELI